MNELELLTRYGEVEPVDPALIDAAISRLLAEPGRPGGAGHGPRRPRRHRTRFVSVGAAAAAAAAIGIVVSGTTGSSPSHPARPASQAPDVLTTYVLEHSWSALANTGGYVEHVVQQDSSGTEEFWRGPTQLLDEFRGQSATLWTWTAGVDTVVTIDDVHHTWSTATFSAPSPPAASITGPPPPGAYRFSPKGINGPEANVTTIVGLFHRAGAEVTATATIDGSSTYVLEIPAVAADGQVVAGKSLTAWVDTRTFLPVRLRQDVPPSLPGWTQDFTWEPATSQSLAVFDLRPPPGYRQVAAPAVQSPPSG